METMQSPLYSDKYALKKFHQNNLRILIVASFLFLEQLAYGFFVAPGGSLLKSIYIYSAALMILFVIVSVLFHKRKPARITVFHTLYEMSLGIVGMAIIILRILFVQGEAFHVPTVYIAVLYGIAVIFVFTYWQSLALYAVTTTAAIILIPVFHPLVHAGSYRADIISNGCIAWLVSAMNYRSFIRDVKKSGLIQSQNQELLQKNEQIQQVNSELTELSIRDGLTDLFNRRKLDEDLKDTQARVQRYGGDFAVIIMDLDHFKQVNDTRGHETGDAVLKGVSWVIQQNIRETDVAGRWGGEEFMILCPETGLNRAGQLAERLRRKIEAEKYPDDVRMTASMGLQPVRSITS